MSKAWTVAVIGPQTLAGEALLDALETADFAIRRVHLLDRDEAVGQDLSLAGRDWELGDVAAPPTDLDFAWVTDPRMLRADELARYSAAGIPLIDVSGGAPWSAAAPAWGFVSPLPAETREVPLVLRCADTPTLMLLRLLQALEPALTPLSVDATLMLALSDAGQAAVQALGEETAALLSFRKTPQSGLPVQAAFNVLPEVGAIGSDGHADAERRLACDLPVLLGQPALRVRSTAVWVPVFYAHGISLSLRTRELPEIEAVRAALGAVDTLRLLPPGEGRPTPVTDASGQARLHLGRLRLIGGEDPGLSLWLVGDNQHLGGAAQAIRVAGILVRDYLSGIRQLVA